MEDVCKKKEGINSEVQNKNYLYLVLVHSAKTVYNMTRNCHCGC